MTGAFAPAFSEAFDTEAAASGMLVATPEPDNAPPRVRLDLTAEVPGQTFTVIDITRNGVPLRTPAPVGSDVSVAYDYDAPYGVPLEYTATGFYLPLATPDWTENWASLAAWTGDTADYAAAGGHASSNVAGAAIERDASGTVQRLDVTDPALVRVELLDALGAVVASVQVDSKVTLVADSTTQTSGGGSFNLTLASGVVSASAVDGSWSLDDSYAGDPVTVRVVALGTDYEAGQTFPTAAPAGQPWSAAVDASGNVYVVDTTNKLVRKYNAAGVQLTTWSTVGIAKDIVVDDASSSVYVIDITSSLVRKFSTAGAPGATWSTTGVPDAMALDAAGNVYVTDTTTNRVRKYSGTGTPILNFVATTGDPTGVGVDSAGNIYVVDVSARTLRKFTGAGVFVASVSTVGQPLAVAIDPDDGVFVSDYNYTVVRKFTTALVPTRVFSVPADVYGIGVDDAGDLYLADPVGNIVRKYVAVPSSVGAIVETPTVAEVPFTASDTTVLEVESAWLVHPTVPELSLKIEPDEIEPGCLSCSLPGSEGLVYIDPTTDVALTRASRVAIHEIIGSTTPIVVSTGRRSAGTWTLVLQTCGLSARDRLVAVLDDQSPLLLQVPGSLGYDIPTGWFSLGDEAEERLSDADLRLVYRRFTLPMQPVAQPAALTPFGHTWADLLAEGLTWGDVLATYGTWINVLTGDPA